MLLPHLVTVHPSELVTDPDGNPVRRPRPAGVLVDAYVQPVTSAEDTAAGQADQTRHVAYLDPTAPRLDAYSRLVWDGRTFDTVGDALYFTDPDGAAAHWRVTLRKGDS
jgi:hypothetical protein